MNEKQLIISHLIEEFDRWEELLSNLTETQITAPDLEHGLSIKDVIAHLLAWQQRSVARLEAGIENREPMFSGWAPELDPESDEDLDRVNAWILDANRERDWPSVHRDWRKGFLKLLELAKAVPEQVLIERGRFAWLE